MLKPRRFGRIDPEAVSAALVASLARSEFRKGHCQLVSSLARGYSASLKIPSLMPRLKGYRFPREVIACAVWVYYRFAVNTAAARGVFVSRETIRRWIDRFGPHFAGCVKRDRPRPNGKWHLDEAVIPINGEKFWLWRAVDANGDVPDILMQKQRNAKAAKQFLPRLIGRFGEP